MEVTGTLPCHCFFHLGWGEREFVLGLGFGGRCGLCLLRHACMQAGRHPSIRPSRMYARTYVGVDVGEGEGELHRGDLHVRHVEHEACFVKGERGGGEGG